MLNRKYFPLLPAVENSHQKFIIRGQFLHFLKKWIYHSLIPQNDANGISNSEYPEQTVPMGF